MATRAFVFVRGETASRERRRRVRKSRRHDGLNGPDRGIIRHISVKSYDTRHRRSRAGKHRFERMKRAFGFGADITDATG